MHVVAAAAFGLFDWLAAARAFVWDANHAAFSAVGPTVPSLGLGAPPFLPRRPVPRFPSLSRGSPLLLLLFLLSVSPASAGLAIAFRENALSRMLADDTAFLINLD